MSGARIRRPIGCRRATPPWWRFWQNVVMPVLDGARHNCAPTSVAMLLRNPAPFSGVGNPPAHLAE